VQQLNSISANLITPYVQELFINDDKSQKEQIKSAKKFSFKEFEIAPHNLRFISGNNVRLRSKPSTSSQIIDELVIGQVVTITGKKKNWIKVKYMYEENDVLEGWVFTRYTSRFKQRY